MSKSIVCNRCGEKNLRWTQTKAGKWFLTPSEGVVITGENGRGIKTLYLGHRCKSPEELEIEAGFQPAANQAHKLEAEAAVIKTQIDQLLEGEEEVSDETMKKVNALFDQSLVLANEIKALQDKYNKGWKF